ncbi:hypothetical protein FC70_GL000992 [Paucilactobacillus oligofermentans DSM 15707 = LMG 22743]|uniref:Uncharacterized protein n=2 Tax=Paucilactobacillus oligofermentans TaxID=293371 RepID=A0A0R1RPR4_9LACO|nr:hypothetical protein FC70_GL000992 [Paucilactobacillus oligofermentans DSM 15707 = LMG 22743]
MEVVALLTGVVLAFFSSSKGSSFSAGIFAITFTISFFASVIMFFMLTVRQERVWTRNFYRLIPVSSSKFYLANLGSVFLNYLYFGIAQVLLLLIFNISGLISSFKYLDEIVKTLSEAKFPYQVIFSAILLIFIMVIFIWIFVTLIHLIVESISTFLPTLHEKIYRVILYVLVSFVVLKIAGYISNVSNNLFVEFTTSLDKADVANTAAASMLMASGYFTIAVIFISFINVFLLKKWVETDPRSI